MDTLTIPQNCVVFDTETTGFEADNGDRLVEIGGVIMRDGLPTGETYHCFINPQRSVPQSAVDVHGLTTSFLADKPLFDEVVEDFLAFVGDLPMVAHNAPFDAGFINAELSRIGLPTFQMDRFVDSLPIARKKFPGQVVTLDALCRKMKISLDARDKHGALIDSELLAEVCVELMGGRQASLFSEVGQDTRVVSAPLDHSGIKTMVLRASSEELERHAALVSELGADSIWARYMETSA